MNKLLKLTSVSMLTIVATTGARAAGYTCEELIEYTSCNPGYYYGPAVSGTGMVCPDHLIDAKMYNDGICWDTYSGSGEVIENVTQQECNAFDYNEDSVDAGWIEGPVCVGVYAHRMGELGYSTELVEGDIYTDTCIQCPAGSICAGGDVEDAVATPCPAGSYCATAGLSQPTGLCAAGTYSTGGATSANCITCPQLQYTNADGETVYVTATSPVGADALNKCAIASGQTFTDKKGEYTFKESCYYVAPTTYKEACELNYESVCGVITEDNQFFCVESGDADECGCDYHQENFIFNEETGEFYCEYYYEYM